jgi:rhodanese-related sulfurtransferase
MFFGKPLATLSPFELDAKLKNGEVVLIDVRERAENEAVRIEGCMLLPLSEFSPSQIPQAAGKSVVIYCRSGARSAEALKKCVNAGIDNIAHLGGGIIAWSNQGLPTMSKS